MKAKKSARKPLYKAEGGDITSARTFGESQRHVPRQMAQSGGLAGAVNRAVQKATRPKAEVDALEKRAQKAKKRL